jgi:lysophospholipase L1-like esterase
VLRLAPTNGVTTVTEGEFRSLPGIFSPGQQLVDRRNPLLPHHVTIDSLGYRGAEFPRRKAPREFRILLTGDSFSYGDFVDDDQTLPAQLERRLGEHCGHVRVVNAGLGDATIVEEAQLIERGFSLSPDLVVLTFSENDVTDLNRVSTWDRLAANRRAKSRFPLSVVYSVLRYSALWNFALRVRGVASARAHGSATRVDWSAAGRRDSVTPRLRARYRRELLALRDTLAAHHLPFIFVAYPSHFAVVRDSMRGQLAWVTHTAEDLGVPAVNLLAPLVASRLPPESLYLLPRDGHPSPRGYEIAAAYLADGLLAPGSGSPSTSSSAVAAPARTLPAHCRTPSAPPQRGRGDL